MDMIVGQECRCLELVLFATTLQDIEILSWSTEAINRLENALLGTHFTGERMRTIKKWLSCDKVLLSLLNWRATSRGDVLRAILLFRHRKSLSNKIWTSCTTQTMYRLLNSSKLASNSLQHHQRRVVNLNEFFAPSTGEQKANERHRVSPPPRRATRNSPKSLWLYSC